MLGGDCDVESWKFGMRAAVKALSSLLAWGGHIICIPHPYITHQQRSKIGELDACFKAVSVTGMRSERGKS
jgi:hypothetical protein